MVILIRSESSISRSISVSPVSLRSFEIEPLEEAEGMCADERICDSDDLMFGSFPQTAFHSPSVFAFEYLRRERKPVALVCLWEVVASRQTPFDYLDYFFMSRNFLHVCLLATPLVYHQLMLLFGVALSKPMLLNQTVLAAVA